MHTPTRVAVFIDYQNCYGAARKAFHPGRAPLRCGNFAPERMAHVLARKRWSSYRLTYVGVYSGVADSHRDPLTAAARSRQIAAWQRSGEVTVVTRQLRYPFRWPAEPAVEKGIDVKLAIDAVMLAVEGRYDAAIVASCDTDLVPLAEALLELQRLNGLPEVGAIAWKRRHSQMISVAGQRLTYHWVDQQDYRSMQDLTNYAA
jgi:uncharacterized LabA/DUF88 family protein